MKRILLLMLLSLIGIGAAVAMVIQGRAPEPMALPVAPPIVPLFPSFISGTGVVESGSENISVGTPVSGVVATVAVSCGQQVRAGQTLFTLDSSTESAAVEQRTAMLAAARARLDRLKQLPRREDLLPAQARLSEAEVDAADTAEHLRKLQAVGAGSFSRQDLDHATRIGQSAAARVAEAQAQLTILRAGAWQADLDVAQSEVEISAAELKVAEVQLEQRTIQAPCAGEVLQVAIHPGESATPQAAGALILLGAVDTLQVRVDIDENDAWRVTSALPAMAYLRGNHHIHFPLTGARIEPFVVPKRSLSGLGTERIDTRVLEIRYAIRRSEIPIYVGQQLDVLISAPPADAPAEEGDGLSTTAPPDGSSPAATSELPAAPLTSTAPAFPPRRSPVATSSPASGPSL
jgi:HlyD family secretion protein